MGATCLLTLSLSPLPMSEPFSSMRLTVRFVHFSLSPSPWPALSVSASPCPAVSRRLTALSPPVSPLAFSVSCSPCLDVSFSIWYPFCLFLSCLLPSLCLGVPLSMGPSPCTLTPCLLPVFPPLPPGYEKSRSLSSIAGLSGVSLRLAPLATPPGSPRAARRAPPTLPSIL